MSSHRTTPRPSQRGLTSLGRLALGALALAACDPASSSGNSSGQEVMRNTVDNSIVPDVQAFLAASEDFEAGVDGFCDGPDEAGLAALQDEWRGLSSAWSAAAPYNLGPLDDDLITPRILFIESMRQRGDDYTDTVREAWAEAAASEVALDEAYFDGLLFTEVGMLSLEVLVFEDSREGYSTAPADVLGDFEAEPRKCEYLRGMAARLTRDAGQVEYGWTTSFGDAASPFRDQMLEPLLSSGEEPIGALLIALYEHLDYIKVRKLEGILDAQLSGHTYANISATLEAYEALLTQPEPEDAIGILDFMAIRGHEAEVELVLGNLDAAKQAATDEDRDALAAALGLLEGNFKREIPDSLGVQLGLTFTDGD